MSEKVSVIIPVYNAEKYIIKCIKSLLSQTLHECEFIFINDGSEDNSRQIIESYQKLDNRIKLINQKNQGVSVARNTGLNMANGEYVGFVDADDYVDKDMYEVLYKSAKNNDCDVVVSNFESELGGHKIITNYSFPLNTVLKRNYIENELLPYFLKKDDLNTACSKIYKNKIIKVNNVSFPEKIVLGEDGMFNIHFFSHASTMIYVDYTGYHYKEIVGSATRNISNKDYFKRALEVYHLQLPIYPGEIDQVKMWELKSIKLVNSVLSYIHIYFSSSQDVSFRNRYKYVKKMIAHEEFRDALSIFNRENYSTLGRYEKFLISLIKRKFVIGLYLTTAYSRFRNK